MATKLAKKEMALQDIQTAFSYSPFAFPIQMIDGTKYPSLQFKIILKKIIPLETVPNMGLTGSSSISEWINCKIS